MFLWYRVAAKCYAYLSDVDNVCDLERSRWFTRGWTLQELLAPKTVVFYSTKWNPLGSKADFLPALSKITNISIDVLESGDFSGISIAIRLSWARQRETTRVEDLAYCLMGIVGFNMPLIYGERNRAFVRLQEEILQTPDDISLIGWGAISNTSIEEGASTRHDHNYPSKLHGTFANHPRDFNMCHKFVPIKQPQWAIEPVVGQGGVRLWLPAIEHDSGLFAALPYTMEGAYDCYVCMHLVGWKVGSFARLGELVLISSSTPLGKHDKSWAARNIHVQPPTTLSTPSPIPVIRHIDIQSVKSGVDDGNYLLDEVFCLPHAQYSAADGEITLTEYKTGPFAVLFFASNFPADRISDILFTSSRLLKRKVKDRHSRRPRFAVILSIKTTSTSNPFSVTFLHILNGEFAAEDFHFLLNRDPTSIRYCMTTTQTKSLIAANHRQNNPWLLPNRANAVTDRSWIESTVETFILRDYSIYEDMKSYIHYKQKIMDKFVTFELRSSWRNLIEKNMALSATFKTETKKSRFRPQRMETKLRNLADLEGFFKYDD